MKVAIYARVSRADKDDPNSIPVQLADCRHRAAEEGWPVVGEYVDEGISAWNPRKRRPAFERLLRDVEAGRVDVILVREQERLLRQLRDTVRVQELADAGRLRRIAGTLDSDVNFNRARDRQSFRDRASQAQFYSDFLAEKISRTLATKAGNGEWNGGGRRPFGFRVVVDESRRPRSNGLPYYRLEPDPEEAAKIRDAARRVLAGASLYSVLLEWNVAGKPGGGRWTLHDVRRVLLSPQVAGLRVHGRTGLEVEAAWPPILTRDEHRLLQARLPGRNETTARAARRYVLAGLLRCAECGLLLGGRASRRRLRSGAVVERRAYVCNAANGGCAKVTVTAPDLERHLLEAALDRLGPQPEPEPKPDPATEDATVLRELADVEERKRGLGVAYADGLMDAGQVKAATDRLNAQIARLQRQLTVEPARPTYRWLRTVPDFFAFLDREAADLPHEEVAAANEFLRERVTRVDVAPARRPGVRFDPARVGVTWK